MSAFGCVNNTIRLLSGKYLNLADPRPEDFETQDVSGALSKICRFGGQVEKFYSVAEHCVLCSEQAERDGLSADVQLACLLHDAAEAFCGDIVKPLKIMLRGYDEVEAAVERAVAEKYQVDFASTVEAVKEIDHAMLIAERRLLFSADKVEWAGERSVRVLHPNIGPASPACAKAMFEFQLEKLLIRRRLQGANL